jgi:GTPase SAR1 family protein
MAYTHEAKIVIIGERRTRKSSLVEKLKNANYNTKNRKTSTISELNISKRVKLAHPTNKGKSIYANIFDFGAKELDYKTHQLFFTPSALYIMMIDPRYESPNLAYWLKAISQLGRDDSGAKARLLLVVNRVKGGIGTFKYGTTYEFYKEFIDVEHFEIDLDENDRHFRFLLDAIKEEIIKLSITKQNNYQKLDSVRKILKAEKTPYIRLERLKELFRKKKFNNDVDHDEFCDCLHKLGEIIHYQKSSIISPLDEVVILNPQWVLKAVYDLLNDEFIKKQKGEVTTQNFLNILGKKGYNRADAQKIWFLMSINNFDICYKINDNRLLAPLLLSDTKPKYEWGNQNGSLKFWYQFTVMPNNLITRLIAELNTFNDTESAFDMIWKKGMLMSISNLECKILILEDSNRKIVIEVLGLDHQRKYALRKVRDVFEKIHTDFFSSIPLSKIIPCCCDECKNSLKPHEFDLENLLKLARRDINSLINCFESASMVSVRDLLEGVYDDNEIESLKIKKEITKNDGIGDSQDGDIKTNSLPSVLEEKNEIIIIKKLNFSEKMWNRIKNNGWIGLTILGILLFLFFRYALPGSKVGLNNIATAEQGSDNTSKVEDKKISMKGKLRLNNTKVATINEIQYVSIKDMAVNSETLDAEGSFTFKNVRVPITNEICVEVTFPDNSVLPTKTIILDKANEGIIQLPTLSISKKEKPKNGYTGSMNTHFTINVIGAVDKSK